MFVFLSMNKWFGSFLVVMITRYELLTHDILCCFNLHLMWVIRITGIRGSDWVEFDQNQNSNHIRYFELGLVK
jgi:hypothetical protein